jgi:hypothetical protein
VRGTITIPAPVASRGESILVRNYRNGNRWEEGTICTLEYRNLFGTFSWKYEVGLVRPYKVRLFVGDDGIRRLSPQAEVENVACCLDTCSQRVWSDGFTLKCSTHGKSETTDTGWNR